MSGGDALSPLDAALRQFEAVEANLVKLERVYQEIERLTPGDLQFGSDSDYARCCREFEVIVGHLPLIHGWKISNFPLDLNDIGQMRLDAKEIGEISAVVSVESAIEAPGRDIADYRFKFDQRRRQLVRDAVLELIDRIDESLRVLSPLTEEQRDPSSPVNAPELDDVRNAVKAIDSLLGSAERPSRWSDLVRHLYFGQVHDLHDIAHLDWPSIKSSINRSLYTEREPIPIDAKDLGELVASRPRGAIATKLRWERLDAESFERLVFALISTADRYENPEWLMKTSATDRGRDLSVMRIIEDALSGTSRQRVIFQCRHWQSKSVSVADIAKLKEQVPLWEPPRVHAVVIVTSGRFSQDAVQAIERHNSASSGLAIEMWAESHLERLLAERPWLIAEFDLK